MWTIEQTDRGWAVRHAGRTVGVYQSREQAERFRSVMCGRDWN
jgi:hypothetical protein